ncbi:hypothetical protein ACFQ9J_25415 [Streptomyces sp. NPDC056529]|uniref:hypothetical protein n=1 Tax=Streptomyces sp. NPDC056529 TaxID=3345855 RepID=UPI0036C953F0
MDDLALPLGGEQVHYIGQALAKPHMLTTTDNYRDGRLIGLHLDDYARRYPHTDDYRAHAAVGHTTHILRIRLAPGEGYIAPTEYLLHDGSTQDQEASAIAFWLGHWQRGKLPSLI